MVPQVDLIAFIESNLPRIDLGLPGSAY